MRRPVRVERVRVVGATSSRLIRLGEGVEGVEGDRFRGVIYINQFWQI